VAAFVALSRVLRGSHFPTDVFGGAVCGILSGSIASAPWNEWRTSIREGLYHAAIGTVAVFALLWTLSYPADAGMAGALLIGLGVVAMTGGLWLRRTRWSDKGAPVTGWQEKASPALIAYGLACMSTSPLVLASVGFVCLAFWSHDRANSSACAPPSLVRLVIMEGALVAGVLLALTILFAGRNVLPLQ
jgi:undecaprenyl-diphosphatase